MTKVTKMTAEQFKSIDLDRYTVISVFDNDGTLLDGGYFDWASDVIPSITVKDFAEGVISETPCRILFIEGKGNEAPHFDIYVL